MSPRVSGPTGGEFEQYGLPPQQGGPASKKQLGEDRPRAMPRALSGLSPRSGGDPAETNDASDAGDLAPSPEGGSTGTRFYYREALPQVSFVAGQNETQPIRVISPHGFAPIVGEAAGDGTIFTGDMSRLTIQEVVTMAIANASVSPHERPRDLKQPFFLAIQDGEVSVGQQWANVTGNYVVVQQPFVTHDRHKERTNVTDQNAAVQPPIVPTGRQMGRTMVRVDEKNPQVHWFEPGQTEVSANLAFENGRLELTGDDGKKRVASPRRHLGELLFWRMEGTVFRLGAKWGAKMYFPDVDALAWIEHGKKALEPLVSAGLPVQMPIAEPEYLPSGLVAQYFESPAATDEDILPSVKENEMEDRLKKEGLLKLHGPYRIDYSKALMLNDQTITELDQMDRLVRSNRPFHDKNGYTGPVTIGFDEMGRPYFCDPMLGEEGEHRRLTADERHDGTVLLIRQLRAVAVESVATQRALGERG